MKVALLIPEKPNTHPVLRQRSLCCQQQAVASLQDAGIETVVFRDSRQAGDRPGLTLQQRVAITGPLRNALVKDRILPDRTITHVACIDADIFYGKDMVRDLLRVTTCDIVAPMVLLEGYQSRFYDIAGFIEDSKYTPCYPPYFAQQSPIVRMRCVGSFYIVPAEIFHDGATYWSPHPELVEHWGVCEFARSQRYHVLCDTRKAVFHADLRNYGEAWH